MTSSYFQNFVIIVASLLLGFIVGRSIGIHDGFSQGYELASANPHVINLHDHGTMAHPPRDITEDPTPIPFMAIGIEEDPDSGYNLRIVGENFIFAPYNVGSDHIPGEGHAHLYINGEKIARLYAPWYHLPHLPKGEHEIRVTLNSNDHSELTVSGRTIEDVITFVVD